MNFWDRLKWKIDNQMPIDVVEGKNIFSIFGYNFVWWGLSYGKRCLAIYKS